VAARDVRPVSHQRRTLLSAQPGDREPPDVAVDAAHRVASLGQGDGEVGADRRLADTALAGRNGHDPGPIAGLADLGPDLGAEPLQDRKSTRLNSSHVKISYAVFCLKKKKKQ